MPKNVIQLWPVTQWQYTLQVAPQAVSQVLHQVVIGTVVVAEQVGAVCIVAAVSVMFHSVFTLALPLAAAIVLHIYVLLTAHAVIAPQCLWAVHQQDLLKILQAVVLVAFADTYMPAVQVVVLV